MLPTVAEKTSRATARGSDADGAGGDGGAGADSMTGNCYRGFSNTDL
jgi:hypothetical protein